MEFRELYSFPFLLFFAVEGILLCWLLLTKEGGKWWQRRSYPLVVWFVALLGFAVWSLGSDPAAYRAHGNPTSGHLVTDGPYSTCLIYSFPEVGIRRDEVASQAQDPPGCFEELKAWLRRSKPSQLILIGRADRRELSLAAARKYHSNTALALERAREVMNELDSTGGNPDKSPGGLDAKVVLLSSGARYGGNKIDSRLSERDRSVEIRTYWNGFPASNSGSRTSSSEKAGSENPGFALSDQAMESGVSVALLALIVALSAYLAAVRILLQDRRTRPDVMADLDQKEKIEKVLDLLVIPDSLMIASGSLLFLHVFYAAGLATLLTSIRLLTLGGFTLVLFHIFEWSKGIKLRP